MFDVLKVANISYSLFYCIPSCPYYCSSWLFPFWIRTFAPNSFKNLLVWVKSYFILLFLAYLTSLKYSVISCCFKAFKRAKVALSYKSYFDFLFASIIALAWFAIFLRSFCFFLCHSINYYLWALKCCMNYLCLIFFLL